MSELEIESGQCNEEFIKMQRISFLFALRGIVNDALGIYPLKTNYTYKLKADEDWDDSEKDFQIVVSSAIDFLKENDFISFNAVDTSKINFFVFKRFSLTTAGYIFFKDLSFNARGDGLSEYVDYMSSRPKHEQKFEDLFMNLVREVDSFNLRRKLLTVNAE